MKLRGRTASGEAVTVHLDIDEACASCGGIGTQPHPAWIEFAAEHRHTGLPLAEIVRVYGQAWWEAHGGLEPPLEAPCGVCGGTARSLTTEGRALVEALRPYLQT